MKKILSLCLSIILCAGIAGCGEKVQQTQSTVQPTAQAPTSKPPVTVQPTTPTTTVPVPSVQMAVDWSQCALDWKMALTDKTNFSFVKDVNAQVDESTKMITLSAAIADSTSDEIALDFADTMIRQFNLYAQMQDGSIKSASKDYYGGLYDSYSVYVGVAPLSQTGNQKQWYVNSVVTKGMHTKQAPKLNKRK